MSALPIEEYDRLAMERWPDIPWTEPIWITVAGVKSGWTCRLCIARLGHNGRDELFEGRLAAEHHLVEVHAVALKAAS